MKAPSHRIMIVDPDASFVRRVQEALISQGYEAEAVSGVTAALCRMREVNFDCAIVAEEMEDKRGHDAVPIMKAVQPDLPIIVTADRNTAEQETMIRHEDIFFYYLKTFDIRELGMAVDDALTKRIRKTKESACQGR